MSAHWKSRPLDVEEFIHLRFTKKKSLPFIASWFGFSTRGLVFRLRNEGIEYGERIPAKRVEMPYKVDELARAKGYLSMSDLIRCLRPTHSEKQIMKMVGVSKSAVHKHTPEDIKYLYRHETEEYKRKRIERLLAARAKNKNHPWRK